MSAAAFASVARLDLAEVRRSRWVLFTLLVYAALATVFLLVGVRESSITSFTGTRRVLLSFTHALLLLLPLLALTATAQTINRARSAGALELLLTQPIGRWDYFLGVTVVRLASMLLPFAVLTIAIAAVGRLGFGDAVPWAFLVRALLVGSALIVAFIGAGMLIATLTRLPSRALIAMLLTWLAGVALLDFALVGVLLQWQVPARLVFVLAAVNPVEAARLALLAGADPELSVLGPVGFYLIQRLGPDALLALGLAWPAVFGVGCGALAGRAFRRRDAV